MNNFVDDLKKYFATTSKEQVQKDWDKSKDWDNVGPTVDDFLLNLEKQSIVCSNHDPNYPVLQTIENINPKFTLGFFF